jgi:hypothetical protein
MQVKHRLTRSVVTAGVALFLVAGAALGANAFGQAPTGAPSTLVTSDESASPEASETAEPIETAEPSDAPEPSDAAEPSDTPEAADTAEPSEAPMAPAGTPVDPAAPVTRAGMAAATDQAF